MTLTKFTLYSVLCTLYLIQGSEMSAGVIAQNILRHYGIANDIVFEIFDDEGRSSMRNRKALKVENEEQNKPTKEFVVYPNPANAQIRVNYSISSNADLFLYDYNGKIQQYRKLEKGTHQTTINTSNLPQGIYLISIKQNGQSIYSEKISIHR